MTATSTQAQPERLLRGIITAFVFLVVLAICPFTRDPLVPIKSLAVHWCALACLPVLLLAQSEECGTGRTRNPLLPLFAAFVLLNALAAAFAEHSGNSLLHLLRLVSLLVILVAANRAYRHPKHAWRLILTVCAAASIASLYAFVQRAGWDPFPWDDKAGLLRDGPSTFGNPNTASHVLVLTTILAAGLCAQNRTRWPAMFAALFLCHFFLTKTRGSLLALVAAAILVATALIAVRACKPRRATALTILILGLGAAAATGLVGMRSWHATGSPAPFDSTLLLRYHSFNGAARMIQDRPLLGWGPGNYALHNADYWSELETERFNRIRKTNRHVHNEPLELGVEAGVAAAVLYLAILGLGLYLGLSGALRTQDPSRRKLGLTLAAFFLAFLVDGLFGFNFHSPVSGALLFVMAGTMSALGEPLKTPETLDCRVPRLLRWALFAVLLTPALVGTREFAASCYQMTGLKAAAHGKPERAHQTLTRAAALNPFDWDNPFNLGQVCLTLNRRDEAKKHFLRAIELHPAHLASLFYATQTMYDLAAASSGEAGARHLDEALAYMKGLSSEMQGLPENQYTLGKLLYLKAMEVKGALREGRTGEAALRLAWRQASEQLDKAAGLAGDKAHAGLREERYRLAAHAHHELGNFDQAAKAYVEAVKSAADVLAVCEEFYSHTLQSKHYTALLDVLDWQLHLLRIKGKTNPKLMADLAYLKAQVLQKAQGDRDNTKKAYLFSVGQEPAALEVWLSFADFAWQHGQTASFLQALTGAKEHLGADASLVPMAVLLRALNGSIDLPEAGAELHAWHDQSGTPSKQAKLEMGLAIRVLALRAGQDNAGTLLILGQMACQIRDFAGALPALTRARTDLKGPSLLQCEKYRAIALAKLGRFDEAMPLLQDMAARLPRDLEIHWTLARALASEGRTAEALARYRYMAGNMKLTEEMERVMQAEREELAARP